MKRLVYILVVSILVFSCQKYDDTWIKDELSSVNQTIDKLEDLCSRYNSDIIAIQKIITAIQNNDMISNVLYQPEQNSLTLTFSKMGTVTINIKNGNDGEDVVTCPAISFKEDNDGVVYWTIDGEWLKDINGNKIPTAGKDGAPGKDGNNGKPGNNGTNGTSGQEAIIPQLKIEDDYWFISYDNGQNWDSLYKATGENGKNGVNGDSMITSFISDGNYVRIKLNDGSELAIPIEANILINIQEPDEDIIAGKAFSLSFEVSGIGSRPEMTCVGEHGWKGKVTWTSEMAGYITISTPEELVSGKVIIIASYGEYTAMKSVNFDYGDNTPEIMTIIEDLFEVDGSGGIVKVTMVTNQDYQIIIPENAQSWIKHVNTKALREDEILFGISPIKSGEPARSAKIEFKGTNINRSIIIHQRSKVVLESEIDANNIDGFQNPQNGIIVLQTATKGAGTDIIIMGDGFSKKDFVGELHYKNVMEQAYNDFFSVEPYTSLKEYFNVYYINAVSEDAHDAEPYYDSWGNQNGATNGNANTRFGTTFVAGSTSIDGDSNTVLEYAKQAIRYKGGEGGSPCGSEYEISTRANKALMIVMINVKCYAGTCYLAWTLDTYNDYGNAYSIAYCSLGNGRTSDQRKWTLVHEAGGHGFGKLADEYESYRITKFNTGMWDVLKQRQSYGVERNVNEYWTFEESLNWTGNITREYTNTGNVYWAPLLNISRNYEQSEGLGIYEGANTYSNLFCRPTSNSVMRNHHINNGQYFNAISRWAIWYRVMRLTYSTNITNFKESLNQFLEFDKNLSINVNVNSISHGAINDGSSNNDFMPLGQPKYQEMVWVGDELIPVE